MIDVRSFTVGPVQENAYIVRATPTSTRALIVDPGEEPRRLLDAADALGVEIEAILITHCHFDHVGAVAPVARATGAPVYCPQIEVGVLADITKWTMPGFGPFESWEAEQTVAGGERLGVAGLDIEVLFTPGHSPGHVTYAIAGIPAGTPGDATGDGGGGGDGEDAVGPARARARGQAAAETRTGDPHAREGHAAETVSDAAEMVSGVLGRDPSSRAHSRAREAPPTGLFSAGLFSGDVLFEGSVGRVDLPGGDWPTLERSIGGLMERFERHTVVYPGHMGVTTLGREWDTNPFLSELRATAMHPATASPNRS
jgi:hydroxyacylglutathione hydrolase